MPARRRFTRPRPPIESKFSGSAEMPSYKDYEELRQFLTDRAKLVGRDRSGLTAKQQRHLALAVKRARHLGLLPFQAKVR